MMEKNIKLPNYQINSQKYAIVLNNQASLLSFFQI